jgi:hypothetical protein
VLLTNEICSMTSFRKLPLGVFEGVMSLVPHFLRTFVEYMSLILIFLRTFVTSTLDK